MSNNENKIGLYITVIFHLTVIIVLFLYQIDNNLRREESFVLDFSKQEEIEQRMKEEEMKEDISRKLDRLLEMSNASSRSEIKNIAVDSRSSLKDDRNTDAEQLYKDAERLAEDLKKGQKHAIQEDAREETVELPSQKKNESNKEYSGPSVLSYSLDGRKASHLPIPAYRCYGYGDVTVIITVDNSGRVVNAKILDEISSEDTCLRNFAVRAARGSRFNASQTAPARQTGEIVYRFIAQ